MRDTAPRHWQRWRIARVEGPAVPPADPIADRIARSRMAPAAGLAAHAEAPAADGIRHELVARIRREIEAGTYDTEERWLAAEELLLRRITGGA